MLRLLACAAAAGTAAAIKTSAAHGAIHASSAQASEGKHTKDDCVVTTGIWWLDSVDKEGKIVGTGKKNFSAAGQTVIKNLWNQPFVYGDEKTVEAVDYLRNTSGRKMLGTEVTPIDFFPPCAMHGKQIKKRHSLFIHPPTINTTKQGCIDNAKFYLITKTLRNDPHHKWFAWVDIDTKVDEDERWPDMVEVRKLDKEKIHVSATYPCSSCNARDWSYCHCIEASPIIMHKDAVEDMQMRYYMMLDKCLASVDANFSQGGYACMDTRVIMTQMELEWPGTFNIVGAPKEVTDPTISFFTKDRDAKKANLWELLKNRHGDETALPTEQPTTMLTNVDNGAAGVPDSALVY